MRALVVLAIALPSAGCFLSHEPALPSDRACVSLGTGEACGVLSSPGLPEGVCRMRDGRVVAFVAGGPLGSCGRNEADPGTFVLRANLCLASEWPLPRDATFCRDAPASGPITFVGSGERAETFDPPRGECELLEREEPAGPFRPFDEASEICVDLPAWCGAPIVIELVQPAGDGCGGGAWVERCRVEVDGSRIVLEAETAPARPVACETVLVDRVARCVVRPLATGTYEIALSDGRVIDVLDVIRIAPGVIIERRCSPIVR